MTPPASTEPKYRCVNQMCVKGCPLLKHDPKIKGCDYGPDIMRQIVTGMKSKKSRNFDEVVKELGL